MRPRLSGDYTTSIANLWVMDCQRMQWRSEGPAGPATAGGGGGGAAGLKGPARARQEEVVAVTPLPRDPNKLLAGGPKIVATPLRECQDQVS